ncbi:MAG: hypothetical protein A2Y00_04510 [Omnitrophica WOR_2 bacterium GWF2_43_52]|nr:MAG: hypothetical protein A2Y00_04510 [Omnitrophica WOR_2 bacterium GWF2_43_52]OGX52981.1 MAG: hypothetical protein A2460_08045 [Omnitrophica WOR_2 bacterium RIFOXYC2_FULL_43_9]
MTCVICAGEIRKKKVFEEVKDKNNHLLVKVDAEVCLNCGERYYPSGVVDKLISLKESLRKRNLKLHEIGKVYELLKQ